MADATVATENKKESKSKGNKNVLHLPIPTCFMSVDAHI